MNTVDPEIRKAMVQAINSKDKIALKLLIDDGLPIDIALYAALKSPYYDKELIDFIVGDYHFKDGADSILMMEVNVISLLTGASDNILQEHVDRLEYWLKLRHENGHRLFNSNYPYIIEIYNKLKKVFPTKPYFIFDIIKLFLDYCASPNVPHGQIYPLQFFVSHEEEDLAILVLLYGANPFLSDRAFQLYLSQTEINHPVLSSLIAEQRWNR